MKVSDKLMKYIVEITETLYKQLIFEVDAHDVDSAYEVIEEAYRSEVDDEFVLKADDFSGVEIEVKHADEDSPVDVEL